MARVKTYDPKKVKVLFGSLILTGVDEGTFINVETQGDGISAIVGCDQEIVRSIDPSSVLKQVTVTLLQSSSSNAALSLIQDADNQNGAGLLPLTIKDLSGDAFEEICCYVKINCRVRRNMRCNRHTSQSLLRQRGLPLLHLLFKTAPCTALDHSHQNSKN